MITNQIFGVGTLTSKDQRFDARYDLRFSVADPQVDTIDGAPIDSISGYLTPYDVPIPAIILAEKGLLFEMHDSRRKFLFSFRHPNGEITFDKWVD